MSGCGRIARQLRRAAAQSERHDGKPAARSRAACPTMDVMADRHKLIVMRHAKAGELPGGPDFERALRPRGLRDSAAAGSWLAERGFRPDSVICSSARRTRQTWQQLASTLGSEPAFSADQRLYEADTDDLVEIIQQTAPDVGTLLYIGHNPAAAGLVELLTGTGVGLPTAGIAVIAIAGDWAALAARDGELVASWAPRTGDADG
jgi:phosphohistidine phosphatase